MSSLGLLARLDPLSVLTCDARGRLASVHLSQHGSQLFVIIYQEKVGLEALTAMQILTLVISCIANW